MAVMELRTELAPGERGAPRIVLMVSGRWERSELRRLAGVVDALVTTPSPVVVDVSLASTAGLGLARTLCAFRDRRRRLALPVRVIGLHAENVPDPAGLALPELFAVYEQVRDAA